MTTIAYRDGLMAGDSGSWRGGVKTAGAVKLAISVDGDLVGATGASAACYEFLQAVKTQPRHEWPRPIADRDGSSFQALIVSLDGAVSVLEQFGEEEITAPYYAIGAGAEIAMGAMYAGADAETAVFAAVEHSSYAAAPVVVIRLPHTHTRESTAR